jgi:hypothetical protein
MKIVLANHFIDMKVVRKIVGTCQGPLEAIVVLDNWVNILFGTKPLQQPILKKHMTH